MWSLFLIHRDLECFAGFGFISPSALKRSCLLGYYFNPNGFDSVEKTMCLFIFRKLITEILSSKMHCKPTSFVWKGSVFLTLEALKKCNVPLTEER